jgi:hypothetical protein
MYRWILCNAVSGSSASIRSRFRVEYGLIPVLCECLNPSSSNSVVQSEILRSLHLYLDDHGQEDKLIVSQMRELNVIKLLKLWRDNEDDYDNECVEGAALILEEYFEEEMEMEEEVDIERHNVEEEAPDAGILPQPELDLIVEI